MKIGELLNGVKSDSTFDSNVEIASLCFDSRKAEQGSMFVALCGYSVDGHNYIGAAIERGAVAVVCQVEPVERVPGVEYIVVADSSLALGVISANMFGNPSKHLKLVGVTGTNGKTTTATLMYKMVRLMGYKAGLLSTVCNYIDDRRMPSTHTTPDPITINSLMAMMVEEGCEYCFMEVSSHSAHQQRIAGLDFDGAMFSNITHDHLDYHKTFKSYIEAKKSFFDRLKGEAFALTNLDDKNGMVMLQNTKAKHYTYSCKRMADFNCKVIERHLDSTLLELDGAEVWTKFTGDFNAYNLLVVYATSLLLGFPKDIVLEKLSMLVPVEGRFETMVSKSGVVAVVDYAHTPDAVENVLKTLQSLKRDNKIITVVGAGGDRDRTKRPEMAKAACELSDIVVLTSDNPRSEEPMAILNDMVAGVPANTTTVVKVVVDRAEAIKSAIAMASSGDVVLVAGKGHEDYQEIKGVKYHFSDKEVIGEIFNS
ncbi:MAG: UDP-N-acetylmuramoyl-L-alanyl-D-glutamate--2,6-diaminopimelate ligase [Marinifilaceae bacterium]|nr:UDP-N-acetylmuramoyl-L-alanyl-D-glutamate--2,6-diaminopimelate ligase [Marinifilaceae bacterium]